MYSIVCKIRENKIHKRRRGTERDKSYLRLTKLLPRRESDEVSPLKV